MNKKKFTGTSQSLETRRSVSAILKRRLTVAIWRYPFLILKTLRNEKFTTFSKKKNPLPYDKNVLEMLGHQIVPQLQDK